jgi:sporulation protein YlmC with PRC-barrel domain
MIDLPTNAEVYCSDGIAGSTTYIIGNPANRQITHLVVQRLLPPFHETLVPVDQVAETTDNRIRLKCTRAALNQMQAFEVEEYIPTELPGYLLWPDPHDVPAINGYSLEPVPTFVTAKRQNLPPGELALRRGARVVATDGYVGRVDELLIDSTNMQVTHLVLLAWHIFQKREITIPVSQIDHIHDDMIYLKLDRQSVEELPTAPIQRWSR